MDTHHKIAPLLKKQNGMVLVFVAMALVALFFFVSLAVDLSYRHVAKAELQNAADSSALAGATMLPNYTTAQSAAIAYGAMHKVVGNPQAPVTILPGDITLGHYDKTSNPAWVPGGIPINAVEVWARRDKDTATPEQQSKVDLFFSNLFGYPKIAVAASAIAQRVAHAGGYLLLNRLDCNAPVNPATGTLNAPLSLTPDSGSMGWTSLTYVPTGPGANINDFICSDKVPDVDACAYPLYTTGGNVNRAFQDMEATFFDPDYDSVHKTFDADGAVTAWTIIVPVARDDPTVQPGPLEVWGYATIRIIKACGNGNGNPCGGNRRFFAPNGTTVCDNGENDVVIDQISCFSCADSAEVLGAKAYLVR